MLSRMFYSFHVTNRDSISFRTCLSPRRLAAKFQMGATNRLMILTPGVPLSLEIMRDDGGGLIPAVLLGHDYLCPVFVSRQNGVLRLLDQLSYPMTLFVQILCDFIWPSFHV